MFQTFSGSSRKGRNVNLSGQRSSNSFSGLSWTSGRLTGPSSSVAHAQAERQQRQLERDRLKAAQQIQRWWRGHRVRRHLKECRRSEFDLILRPIIVEGQEDLSVTATALPMLFSFYETSRAQDQERLLLVVRLLVGSKFAPVRSGEVDPNRLSRLGDLLLSALERTGASEERGNSILLLLALAEMIELRPQTIEKSVARLYEELGKRCRSWIECGSRSVNSLIRVLGAPLRHAGEVESLWAKAYHEFAFSFLTQEDLAVFERHLDVFALEVDMEKLSDVILAALTGEGRGRELAPGRLWLLAHFIALQRAKRTQKSSSENPQASLKDWRALDIQLSTSSSQIALAFTQDGKASADVRGSEAAESLSLPPYVTSKLELLVSKEEIYSLLKQFTMRHDPEVGHITQAEAGFLAGYTLSLIHSFPSRSDDILMRLYFSDLSEQRWNSPAVVKFFWDAVKTTRTYSSISSHPNDVLEVLCMSAWKTYNASRDQDWRTILLFLELYNFVLRFTDDDDFFSGLNRSTVEDSAGSQMRSSGLTATDLEGLTVFLKHLCFTLYYHSADILETVQGHGKPIGSLPPLLVPGIPQKAASKARRSQTSREVDFSIASCISFSAFKEVVSSALRMLYERDSRRRFLPTDHWLMTSQFSSMEGFFAAVVLEQQRQQELADQDDSDGQENDDDAIEVGNLRSSAADQRRSRTALIEKFRAQRRKAARDRMLASVAPKLEILRNMPFVIPFDIRVRIFRQFVHLDKEKRRHGHIDPDRWRMWIMTQDGGFDEDSPGRGVLLRHHATIKRGRVFSDAYNAYWGLGDGLKEPIQITFLDAWDIQEAGIDGGGVTKEFLMSVTKEAFTGEQRLLVTNSENAYYPNPYALDQQKEALRDVGVQEHSEVWNENLADLLRQYEFLGRIIGKCLYEGILIDIVFAGFFLLRWAAAASDATYRPSINELRELDEQLYQGLLQLKNYPGDLGDLDVNFTIEDQTSLPGQPIHTVTRELIPNGENVPVTTQNRPLYISKVARHRLLVQPGAQTRAFLRGLGLIISPSWLSMFNQTELQHLVGGDSSEINVEDLRRHTSYMGLYKIGDDGEEHPNVRNFWQVIHELSDAERREVLNFVTSTPRAPLLGFGQLRPGFAIRDGGSDSERLPSASTCVNLLKLPLYPDVETLRTKLLLAVKSGAGFDLS